MEKLTISPAADLKAWNLTGYQMPMSNFFDNEKAVDQCGSDVVGGGVVATWYSAANLSRPLMTW
jgi:hypothetical protein